PAGAAKTAAIAIDCAPPHSTWFLPTPGDGSLSIAWATDEPSHTDLRWGKTAPTSNEVKGPVGYWKSGTFTIGGLDRCADYLVDFGFEDAAGNTVLDTKGGAHYAAKTSGREYWFRDDAEFGVRPWTTSAVSGPEFALSTCRAHSGSHAFKLGTASCSGAAYSGAVESTLTTPVIHDTNAPRARLRFWQWLKTTSPGDKCEVQVRSWGSETWTDVLPPFGGDTQGWVFVDVPLEEPAAVRFRYTSETGVGGEGWYIDDVEVGGEAQCEATPRVWDVPTADVCTGTGAASDGVADPGEHVRLPIVFRNMGSEPGVVFQAILASSDPRVRVTNAYTTLPSLGDGEAGVAGEPPLAVDIADSASCGDQLPISLDILGGRRRLTEALTIPVGRYVAVGADTLLNEHFDIPSGSLGAWLPDGWTVGHIGSESAWAVLGGFAKTDCTGNGGSRATHTASSQLLDTWLAAKPTPLKAGREYVLQFKAEDTSGAGGLQVDLTKDGNPHSSSPTQVLWQSDSFATVGCREFRIPFTVAADGTYTLWFLETSAAPGATIAVDDVVLTAPIYVCRTTPCTGASLPAPGETAKAGEAALIWSGSSKDTLTWGADSAATSGYHLYRGSDADFPHRDGSTPNACVRWSGTATTTGPTLKEVPAARSLQWFLLSGVNDAGEGPAAPGFTINASGICW
ncbi:MAG: hypothetical protein ABFD65_09165, partial [Candidatus Polarisedimenticolia bacterium]